MANPIVQWIDKWWWDESIYQRFIDALSNSFNGSNSNPMNEWIEDLLLIAISLYDAFFLQYSIKKYYFLGAFKSRTNQIRKTTKSDSFPDCPCLF